MPDDYEQELLADIAAAETFGDSELAAELRLELRTYRAAANEGLLEQESWGGSTGGARREALGKRQSDQS